MLQLTSSSHVRTSKLYLQLTFNKCDGASWKGGLHCRLKKSEHMQHKNKTIVG